MAQLVSGHNDSREASRVLHDGHTVDLLQPLVDDARATDVSKPGGAAVAFAVPSLAATHVESGKTKIN